MTTVANIGDLVGLKLNRSTMPAPIKDTVMSRRRGISSDNILVVRSAVRSGHADQDLH